MVLLGCRISQISSMQYRASVFPLKNFWLARMTKLLNLVNFITAMLYRVILTHIGTIFSLSLQLQMCYQWNRLADVTLYIDGEEEKSNRIQCHCTRAFVG